MKQLIKLLSFFGLLLIFNNSTEAQYFYLNDNSVGTLTASEKGDIKFALFTPFENRQNFHFTYSPIKHLSLTGGLFNFKDQRILEEQVRDIKGKTFTGSVGFYYFSNNPDRDNTTEYYQSDQGFLLSFDLGYAKGNIVNRIEDLFYADLDYQKLFGQLGLKYKTTYGSIGMIARATKMNYLKGLVVGGGPDYYRSVSTLSNNSDYNILEIKINAEIGVRQFRLITGFSVEQSYILDSKAPPATRSEFVYFGMLVEVDELIKLFKNKK